LLSLKAASQLTYKARVDSLPFHGSASVLPHNFYNQHLGFFCKKENQLQKGTGFNLFVRLGSKNYVDFLERKPNAVK
jgi:hypothetical protein